MLLSVIIFLLMTVLILRRIIIKLQRTDDADTFFEYGNSQIIGQEDFQNDYFSVLTDNSNILAVIADGMSNKKAGKYPAVVAVEVFKFNFLKKKYRRNTRNFFSDNYEEITHQLSTSNYTGKIRCTMLSTLICNGSLYWSSIGNCKLFLFRNGELITVNNITLNKEQFGKISLDNEDIFLLCTHGAHTVLGEMEIINILLNEDMHPYDKALDLTRRIQNKNFDYQKNATIIILENLLGKVTMLGE